MPAYNAGRTLEQTYHDLPHEIIDEIILVDDASSDNTVEVANKLGLTVVMHKKNRGYGGNQKTCYKTAVEHGAEVIVMVHPDHQYDPRVVPELVKTLVDGNYLAVFGSRMINRSDALAGGMPKWKFFFNIVLTKIGNFVLGTKLTEFHTGFRAYSSPVFKLINIENNSDDFVFDTQIIIQLAKQKIPIKEVPIKTRYFKEASQIGIFPSIKYGSEILYNLFLYIFNLRKF